MANPARVASEIHSRSEPYFHHATGPVGFGKDMELELGELCRLFEEDNIIRLALVLDGVLFTVTVSQTQPGTVGEEEGMRFAVILADVPYFSLELQQVVFLQVLVRAPDEQDLNTWIPERQQYSLASGRPTLAAATRTPVCQVPSLRLEKLYLFWVWVSPKLDRNCYSFSSSLIQRNVYFVLIHFYSKPCNYKGFS